MSQEKIKWLEEQLQRITTLTQKPKSVDPKSNSQLKMGIDLGTSNIVTVVLNAKNLPVAACITPADVVRDGIVWDFFGAVTIVKKQIETLQEYVPNLPTEAITSFPPGTEARISANVLDAAGVDVKAVIDEPSAVAHLLDLDNVAIVDIGGGTTGVAIIKDKKVIYSADEPTGGHHITLTLSGNQKISMEDAEAFKKREGKTAWSIARPVFEKMTDIVAGMLTGYEVDALYLSGGSCMMPGVPELFTQSFPTQKIVLPKNAIFLTPYAIAAYDGKE